MSGPLDPVAALLAEKLVDTFVKSERPFRRVTATYDPLDPGATSTVTVVANVKTGPIAPFVRRQGSTEPAEIGDEQVFVSSRHLAAKDFDPRPSNDSTVEVQVRGEWLRVVRVQPHESGDDIAGYTLQLRK